MCRAMPTGPMWCALGPRRHPCHSAPKMYGWMSSLLATWTWIAPPGNTGKQQLHSVLLASASACLLRGNALLPCAEQPPALYLKCCPLACVVIQLYCMPSLCCGCFLVANHLSCIAKSDVQLASFGQVCCRWHSG